MNKQRFFLFIVSLLFVAPIIVSAQDAALVRFGYFPQGEIQLIASDDWFRFDFDQANANIGDIMFPDLMTRYHLTDVGEQTIEYSQEGGVPFSYPIVLEAGYNYSVITVDPNQPPIVINESIAEDGLEEGENPLIIVSDTTDVFRILDDVSPTPLERTFTSYEGYLQTAASPAGTIIERIDLTSQETLFSLTVPYLPNTTLIINGDSLIPDADGNVTVIPNYSTSLSVADWLAGIQSIENLPFTVANFLSSAESGGFGAAIQECEDYMWLVWTDAAFDALSSANQSYVSGAGAGNVVNDSVLQPATTSPWLLSPTATRGGVPLTFANPFAGAGIPDETFNGIRGNVLMTLSTTGSGVQNVVHIVDLVPVSETGGAPSGISLTYDQAFFTLP